MPVIGRFGIKWDQWSRITWPYNKIILHIIIGNDACAVITHSSVSGWELHAESFACDLNSHDLVCKHSGVIAGCGINAAVTSCPQCQMTCNRPSQSLSACDADCSSGCGCLTGFAYDDVTNQCVPYSHCPEHSFGQECFDHQTNLPISSSFPYIPDIPSVEISCSR